MAMTDDYRRGIEHAVIRAELSPSEEIKKVWLNIREQYEYLLGLEASINGDDPFSNSKPASNS